MNCKPLIRNLTTAVRMLVITTAASAVVSQTETAWGQGAEALNGISIGGPDYIKSLCKDGETPACLAARKKYSGLGDEESQCRSAAKELGQFKLDMEKKCGNKRSDKCKEWLDDCSEARIAKERIAPESGSSSSTFMGLQAAMQGYTGRRYEAERKERSLTCDELLSGGETCPEADVRRLGGYETLKDKSDSYEDKRDDAQKDLQDLMEKQADSQAASQKSALEAEEQMTELEDNYRQNEAKTLDRMNEGLQNSQAIKLKAYQEGRETYNSIDQKYIQMRDEARRTASALNSAKDNLTQVCRATAAHRFQEAEGERRRRIAMERAGKFNEQQTAMAGTTARRAKRDTKSRNQDYTAFYNDCMAGVTPEGAAAIRAIKDAERKKLDDEAKLVDIAANIEKQRLELLHRLKELEAQVAQQDQALVKKTERDINDLRANYVKARAQLQKRVMLAQQEQMQKQTMYTQQIMAQQQRVNQLGSRANLYNQQAGCLQDTGVGGLSADDLKSTFKDAEAAIAEFEEYKFRCMSLIAQCSQFPDAAYGQIRACESTPGVGSPSSAPSSSTKSTSPIKFTPSSGGSNNKLSK